MGRLAIATLAAFVLVAAPASAACDAAGRRTGRRGAGS